ncbi:hypothetical protein L3X38_032222 [Prunus dulcis]|uniref:Uncharacterized protein n=1 Tax=Prunus dulcis TaxID=3755 RepID=A0AAD4VDP4_PRUDU|nr:hypothetical protein L3X38_032222 [Prunus dulcis]
MQIIGVIRILAVVIPGLTLNRIRNGLTTRRRRRVVVLIIIHLGSLHFSNPYVYNDLPVEPMLRPISPTGSTRSSLSVDGKSKAELQEIARQLILQASQMDDDEDNDSPSSSSCQPILNPVKPKSWYDDSQDPYDAYDLHSD